MGHIFSKKIYKTITLLFVSWVLLVMADGGLICLLQLLGLPLDRFSLTFGTIKWWHISSDIHVALFNAVVWILCFGLILVLLYRSEGIRPRDLGLTWSMGKDGTLKVLWLNLKILVALCLVLVLLINILYYFFHWADVSYIDLFNPDRKRIVDFSFDPMVPLAEEIVFRGVFCTLLARYGLRWRYIILITALLFGLAHFINLTVFPLSSVVQTVVSAMIAGCFLGWIFYKTRTLLMPVCWHYFFNTVIHMLFMLAHSPSLAKNVFSFFTFVK